MTEHIGTRELRADLAAHLRRAGAGHVLVVTAGGRAVATLGPVDIRGGAASLDALAAAGLLIPPRRSGRAAAHDPVSVWSGVRLDQALRDVRG
jgi:antitoxin (DNA-binding transcriptional repressor) of toxin-antitoxin stability system